MDTKKLDKWAEKLLDTGKRNNLINFHDNKSSTAEVVFPSSDEVFEKVKGTASFEVFDPKFDYEDEPDEEEMSDEDESDEEKVSGEYRTENNADIVVRENISFKEFYDDSESSVSVVPSEDIGPEESYREKYSEKITRKQILLYNAYSNPVNVVKNIDKRNRSFIEETGVNVAYMAFGFIHWTESEYSYKTYSAPILLVPIQLERASIVDPYYIKSTGDDVIVNPTFSYKLEAEYGIKLPEYENESEDESALYGYLENVRELLSNLRWEVTSECKIGIFSFQKINMYVDLKENAEDILSNPNVRLLLGEADNPAFNDGGYDETFRVENPLIELHNVVDADSSQIEAIEMAKSGRSFVLQGPPGTGKSQTITNIIAECLSDGKKILFVSEKLAALSVVYENLKKADLGEFCLQIHSQKANKREVITDICHTMRLGKINVSSNAETEIEIKRSKQKELDLYAAELHKKNDVINKSLYQLYESYSKFRSAPDIEWPVPNLESKGEEYLREALGLLEKYVKNIPSVGDDYRKNTWYGYINQDTSYQANIETKKFLNDISKILRELNSVLREIFEKYGIKCKNIESARRYRKFFAFASESRLLTPKLLQKDNFDAVRAAFGKMKPLSVDILTSRSVLDDVFDSGVYDENGEEIYARLKIEFGSLASRLLHSEYRQLIGNLSRYKKNKKKLKYTEVLHIFERLAYYQRLNGEFSDTEAKIRDYVGEAYIGVSTDWDYIEQEEKSLQEVFDEGIFLGNLPNLDDFSSEKDFLMNCSTKLNNILSAENESILRKSADYFDSSILNIDLSNSDLLQNRFEACLGEIDGLNNINNWLAFQKLLSELEDKQVLPYIHNVISNSLEAEYIEDAFKKLFYLQWIWILLPKTKSLDGFDRISHDAAVRDFSEKDIEQFEINKAKIRSTLSAQRPAVDMVAPGSSLSILLREEKKKRRHKSIRALLSEAGELIQLIKPCFLMSPLSVSTFLQKGAVHFDVVIFDEASQIFPEDAVGAIYRGKQLIVVGDSKQMPPSNFFNASIEADDDDEETGDINDFESILDLCSVCMSQLRLLWHYRSRYEQLITFSNKNFYDSELITFPSSRQDAPGIGVDYYYVDGFFNRKSHTNREEAEYIVDLIYENIEKYPDRSLGVVAFSIKQQELIERLLSRRRLENPDKEAFFRNDEEEPFFIKNLETVQGDERDTIIFSIAYGKDAQGRLYHNFGPLNRLGGERRLNVAVTRAKCNVQLVSSMHHTDIDLSRTSSEGARLLKEYLDYAENGEISLERAVSVNEFEQFDSDFEQEVCEFLKSSGFSVDTQIGCSGYRIDLGLKRPDSSDYVLAIECDGATFHSSKNARDRDRLRQEILERMGWKFYRIWSTDWFKYKVIEKARLLQAARDALESSAADGNKDGNIFFSDTQDPQCVEEEIIADKPWRTHRCSWPQCVEEKIIADKQDYKGDEIESKSFEEKTSANLAEFPEYETADIVKLVGEYFPKDFQGLIKGILEVEAPLSEEFLLKRIVPLFGREKVTNVVQREYKQLMTGYSIRGIVEKGGFLYLKGQNEFKLRRPGKIKRNINWIAPEELASGMYEIIKQNITVNKTGLFQLISHQCGFSRVGDSARKTLDSALKLLKNVVDIDGEIISIK